jgi:hypothetical protein
VNVDIPGNFLLVNGAKPCQLYIYLFPLLQLLFGPTIRYIYGARPAGRQTGFIGTGIADLIQEPGSFSSKVGNRSSLALISEENLYG